MGGVLGSVLGGGQKVQERVEPDEIQKAINKLYLSQLTGLFDITPYSEFAEDQPELFSLSPETERLVSSVVSPDNILTIQDYIDLGLDEGAGFISQIAKPEILSTLALQGMEGSGAAGENIARATASIALPFLSTLPTAAPALTQQGSNIVALSDLPRQLQREDFLRKQNVVQTGLTGIPFAAGTESVSKQRQLPLFNLFGMGNEV